MRKKRTKELSRRSIPGYKAPALVDTTPQPAIDLKADNLIMNYKPQKTNMNRIKRFWNKPNNLIKRGIQLLIIGTSPLLIAIGLDALGIIDGGNFLLFGMIAGLFFYPSLLVILFGVIEEIIKYYFKRK
jgi:hypothetical protein